LIGWPVVTKPLSGNHGRGVTTNITSIEDLKSGYEAAHARHETVIVERYIKGEDHRMLVIGGKLVAAARRRPAHVTGDGTNTIQQLIELENTDPRRGVGHENLLTQIHVDEQTHRMLEQAGYTLDTVLAKARDRVSEIDRQSLDGRYGNGSDRRRTPGSAVHDGTGCRALSGSM